MRVPFIRVRFARRDGCSSITRSCRHSAKNRARDTCLFYRFAGARALSGQIYFQYQSPGLRVTGGAPAWKLHAMQIRPRQSNSQEFCRTTVRGIKFRPWSATRYRYMPFLSLPLSLSLFLSLSPHFSQWVCRRSRIILSVAQSKERLSFFFFFFSRPEKVYILRDQEGWTRRPKRAQLLSIAGGNKIGFRAGARQSGRKKGRKKEETVWPRKKEIWRRGRQKWS